MGRGLCPQQQGSKGHLGPEGRVQWGQPGGKAAGNSTQNWGDRDGFQLAESRMGVKAGGPRGQQGARRFSPGSGVSQPLETTSCGCASPCFSSSRIFTRAAASLTSFTARTWPRRASGLGLQPVGGRRVSLRASEALPLWKDCWWFLTTEMSFHRRQILSHQVTPDFLSSIVLGLSFLLSRFEATSPRPPDAVCQCGLLVSWLDSTVWTDGGNGGDV